MEGVHKNAIFTNFVSSTSSENGGTTTTTIVKIEPEIESGRRRKKATLNDQLENSDIPSSVASNAYKSISIIASGAETAALGLVSIGNFDHNGSATLEPQSIIVEDIDLQALNPAFVTSTGNQI